MIEKLKLTSQEKENFLEDLKIQLNKCKRIKDLKLEPQAYFEDDSAIEKPLLCIYADTYIKMRQLVLQSPTEISWHGLIKNKNNTYIIYDILMFPQKNTSVLTDTDQEEYSNWMASLLSDEKFPIEDLRMHGHSHVDMAVFSSGTDDNYQKELLTQLGDDDYYVFLICNKKEDMNIFFYDYKRQYLFTDKDIEFHIIDRKGNYLDSWAKTAIEHNCKSTETYTKNPLIERYYPTRKFGRRNFYGSEQK